MKLTFVEVKRLVRRYVEAVDNYLVEAVDSFQVSLEDNYLRAVVDNCYNIVVDVDSLVQDWDYMDTCDFCCVCRVFLESWFLVHNIEFQTSYI